jgi:hypothetical protein
LGLELLKHAVLAIEPFAHRIFPKIYRIGRYIAARSTAAATEPKSTRAPPVRQPGNRSGSTFALTID